MKRLGLSDFLELKTKRENEETQIKEYKSKLLGGTIAVKKISPYKVTELMDKSQNEETSNTSGLRGNLELIYKHCPDFSKKELLDAYNCPEPYDVILKIFDNNIGEINDFAEYIMSLYGMFDYEKKQNGKENVIGDDIKNS